MVQETTEKIRKIKKRMKAALSRQKSYAYKRHRPLEFAIGVMVFLKVSPMKRAVRIDMSNKLNPRYAGPFEILERIGHWLTDWLCSCRLKRFIMCFMYPS